MGNRFLEGIVEIDFALYSSSWGRLQCNAKTYDDKKYHSWAGLPDEKLTLDMLVDAIKSVDKQIQDKEVKMNKLLTADDGHEFRRDNDALDLAIPAEDAFDYGFEEGAKAQLKKMIEWLQNTSMDAHITVFQVSTKEWETLQKEV